MTHSSHSTSHSRHCSHFQPLLWQVNSFLGLLSGDLSDRLAGKSEATATMPIIAAVVAQLQLGLWARLATHKYVPGKPAGSAHHYAVCLAQQAAQALTAAAACADTAVLSQSLNRSVFALIVPAFCVLVSQLKWDLSNEHHVELFHKWLDAAGELASAIESVQLKLPSSILDEDTSSSKLWKVELAAGINVRVEPNLKADKGGQKLMLGMPDALRLCG